MSTDVEIADPIDRIAAAPITWGVSEVPGWGFQMGLERVLGEIRSLGLKATESGPDGFLPTSPERAAETLQARELRLVGGFVPAPLHLAGGLDPVKTAAELMQAAGADVLVLAAVGGLDGYDELEELRNDEWARLLSALEDAESICAESQLSLALHPHVGTVIERREELDRVLSSSPARFCLDTGHLLAAGIDPVEFAIEHSARVSHVHLKDVNRDLAGAVAAGRTTFSEAISHELFTPLGEGSLALSQMIGVLEENDYAGWYVLEQDTKLEREPPPREGPVSDAKRSVDRLIELLDSQTKRNSKEDIA